MKQTQTTNPQLVSLIRQLKKESREQQAPIWHDVAEYLSKTRSQRISVNLSTISRNTKRSDTVVVPGKILASGNLDHAVTVASFGASEKAKAKLEAAKANDAHGVSGNQRIVEDGEKGIDIPLGLGLAGDPSLFLDCGDQLRLVHGASRFWWWCGPVNADTPSTGL